MSAATDPRKKLHVETPAGATHFGVYRISRANGQSKAEKLRGDPDETGYVPDTWPVPEFSPQKVLALWGDGKYRVEWYGADSEHMKGKGQTFEVAQPKARKPARKLGAHSTGGDAEEPLERVAAQIGSGQPLGVLELMALMRQEREEQREIAAAQAERDRNFWMQMQSQQTQLLQTIMGRSGAGEDSDLLKREMALELEKKMFELRQEFAAGAEEPDDPEDPDDRPPPKDLSEAADRIGLAFLAELEGAAPAIVHKMIPRLVAMLEAQGLKPSVELQARIAAAQNGHANRA